MSFETIHYDMWLQVSWLRARDTSVLSVGHHTFSSDKRISVQASSSPEDRSSVWSLQIESVSASDQGWYDCQVNTEPKVSHKSYLRIIKKSASLRPRVMHSELRDEPSNPQVIPEIQQFLDHLQRRSKLQIRSSRDLEQLKEGDPLVLECGQAVIQDNPITDLYWIRGGKSGDNRRSSIPQIPEKATLKISALTPSDEGSYTCLSHTRKVAPVSIQIKLSGKLSAILL